MNMNNQNRTILAFTLPLVILIIFATYCGLFVPGTYSKETVNWTAQAIGQDVVNLVLLVPFLIITSLLVFKKNRIAFLLWSGGIFYLIYSYAIYCFALHFNNLFLVYCLILSLSFYSFMYFLFSQIKEPIVDWFNEKIPNKTIGIYLLFISCFFYIVWLSEIIPSIANDTTPKNIIEIGILTNPVHVLDLSVYLPALLITSILLFRKKTLGLLLAPAMITFCILMDITIGSLVIVMKMRGLDADWSVAFIMSLLALISLLILILFLKSLRTRND
jgi:hypothetical protein